jgi:hypothetical protein
MKNSLFYFVTLMTLLSISSHVDPRSPKESPKQASIAIGAQNKNTASSGTSTRRTKETSDKSKEAELADFIIGKVRQASTSTTAQEDDPLLQDAKKLTKKSSQETIRKYLKETLGDGTDEEKETRFSEVLSNFDLELSDEKQVALREGMKGRGPAKRGCPWISCSLHICCK